MKTFLADFPIKSIDIDNENYPCLLKQIPDPPKALYYRGEFPFRPAASGGAERPGLTCFAIVGTRLASDYGKEIAFSFASQLAQAGLTIVSGMALGIDTFSHRGALEATDPRALLANIDTFSHRGALEATDPRALLANRALGSVSCPTMAVLGTGLDEQSIYPQENLRLAKQILEKGGCLISEYPEGTRGTNFTFPQRNRIIAGLSVGVLVVEAKIKSGALITASLAKKYKRKVFAVPGSINSQNSRGCHLLIKQNAKLTENANDIIKELGINCLFVKQQTASTSEEQLIIEALQNGALRIDAMIEKTKLPPQTVSSIISIMEMEEKIKNLGGNIYAINR